MSTDSTVGTLLALYTLNLGDELATAAASGATVLTVTAGVDFPETGGAVLINGTQYDYESADPVAETITLSTGLVASASQGDRVDLINPATGVAATETRALVAPAGSDISNDDAMDVAVQLSSATFLGEGVRDLASGEQVSLQLVHDQWTLTNIAGQSPLLDRCRATMTTGQDIPNATYTAVVWTDPDVYDMNGMHNSTTHPSRITIQTSGWYTVSALIGFAGNASGTRELALYKNGSLVGIYMDLVSTNTNQMMLSMSDEMPLLAGDYLEIFAYQSSGGSLFIDAGGSFPAYFTVRRTP